MSTGDVRLVWHDKLINRLSFIPKSLFNINLINTDSTVGERVIRVYSPNAEAGYFDDLIKINDERLIWKVSDYIFTEDKVRSMLGISKDKEFILIK